VGELLPTEQENAERLITFMRPLAGQRNLRAVTRHCPELYHPFEIRSIIERVEGVSYGSSGAATESLDLLPFWAERASVVPSRCLGNPREMETEGPRAGRSHR
jgi:hypothetical protein